MTAGLGSHPSTAPLTARAVQPLLVAVALALVVAAAAPALRTLYPILYVIGEDWSYPGVGAVGLVLYLAPLLAALAARARPRTGTLIGAALVVLATSLLLAADPISRYAAGAATVLALSGATMVALHLSATGVRRPELLAGLVLGLVIDTAARGAAITWDLVWHSGIGLSLLALVIPVLALGVSWVAVRDDPDVARTTVAPRAAVVGVGGLIALSALFLQSPGFVSALAAIPYWAGLLVALAAGLLALLALPLAARFTGAAVVALLAVAAGAATAATTIATGAVSVPLVLVTLPLLVLLAAVALAPEGEPPARPRPVAGPARAAGAAAFGLLVVFVWQFYIDTALPFPRWVIAVVPVVVLAGAALLAVRRHAPAAAAEPRLTARAALAGAVAAVLAVVVALLGTTTVQAQAAASPTLRVMAYNIRSAADVDGQIRPDVIADVIRSYSPDVVMLSEVGRGWPIHAGTDVAAYLERELGYTAQFMGTADDQFGNLVLSRLPMTVRSTGFLPDAGGQRRSYTAVDVDVAGTQVLVVGAHLQDRSIAQMQSVLDVVSTDRPAILLGDLNTWPDLAEAATLTSTGLVDVVAATGDVCRTTSAQPTRPCDRPDWILTTDDLRIDDVQIGTTPASDHLPLVAVLTLP